ncbi:UNVERIFIED_CONTAM: hypothetical protein HDU68_009410, partial [Siphonaria sp. JEL0065]
MTQEKVNKFATTIGVLAVCSGVATVNGQQWMDGIDILHNLDMVYNAEEGQTGIDVGLEIKEWLGYSSPKAKLLVVCKVEMKSLCIDLARLFQVPMNESSNTLEELTDRCADAFEEQGIAEYQNLISALRTLDSVTITPHVCNVLSAAIVLLKPKLGYDFPEFRQIVDARPDVSLENRQINALDTSASHTSISRYSFYDLASKDVSENVKTTVIRRFLDEGKATQTRVTDKREGFEDWTSDRIDEQTTFTFDKYGGNVVAGT